MNPKDAVKAMVNDYPGGDEALLPRISGTKSLETFQKELRGAPGFKLDLNDAALIADHCHELGLESAAGLVRSLAQRVGLKLRSGAARRAPTAAEVTQDLCAVLREQADVAREVTEAGLDGSYSLNEVKRIERECDEAIAALQKLQADVRAAYEASVPAHLRAVGGAR